VQALVERASTAAGPAAVKNPIPVPTAVASPPKAVASPPKAVASPPKAVAPPEMKSNARSQRLWRTPAAITGIAVAGAVVVAVLVALMLYMCRKSRPAAANAPDGKMRVRLSSDCCFLES
jgi:hypothetical protein